MKKYIEFYTFDNGAGDAGELTMAPNAEGYLGMLFIVQGKTMKQAKEKASIACYTLRIDEAGELCLTKER